MNNLRDQGYPASFTEGKFKSRKTNYVPGAASVQRTEPLGAYMHGKSEALDENKQENYINSFLGAVNSPVSVNRWNSKLDIDIPWQDVYQKGYSFNMNDNPLGRVERFYDPYGRGTEYVAAVNNLEPIFGEGYKEKYYETPLGNLYFGYEDGTAAASYSTPSQKQQMYYINALMKLLNRGR